MPTLAVYLYLRGLAMDGKVHERQLVRRIAEVESNMLPLRPFFRLVRYGAVRGLS